MKARLEEFNDLAGHQEIHKGMTSRDLTENVEQLQVFSSLRIIHDKAVASLSALARRAHEWRDVIIAGRTHNVAAQPTTFGKRLAMFGEEIIDSFRHFEHLIESYPVRGLKGAVGTQMDQLSLFEGNPDKVRELERGIASHLGLPSDWVCVGQVYPRSLDLRTVSALTELTSAPSSLCTTLRLMAGHELASEGFARGQTGSSAMPHKMNARSCERVNGFHIILKGYLSMGAGLSGTQWNEGDVSCSVVRRVMLPDAFFAADGLFETFLTILGQMQVFAGTIDRENERYMPFLLSTSFLMAAVKAGAGRETAHEAIKEHALAVARELREGAIPHNDLLDRLAADERIPVSREDLQEVFEAGQGNTGAATAQVDAFHSGRLQSGRAPSRMRPPTTRATFFSTPTIARQTPPDGRADRSAGAAATTSSRPSSSAVRGAFSWPHETPCCLPHGSPYRKLSRELPSSHHREPPPGGRCCPLH